MKLKVLFVGNSLPIFETLITNRNVSVVAFITENPEISTLGRRVFGPGREIRYLDFISGIKNQSLGFHIDLGICASYGILPESLLDFPELGFVNIHPADLPFFAGRYPYPQIVESKVDHSYSTLHVMTKKIDEGKILSRFRYTVDVNDYYEDWLTRSNSASCELITRFLDSSPRKVLENLFEIDDPKNVIYNPKSSLPNRDLSASPELSLSDAIRINCFVGGTRLFRENGDSIVIFRSQLIHLELVNSEMYQVLNSDELGFVLGVNQLKILRVTNWSGEKLREMEKIYRSNVRES